MTSVKTPSNGLPDTNYARWSRADDLAYQALTGRMKAEQLGFQVVKSGDYLGNDHRITANGLTQGNGGKYAPKGPDIPHPEIKPRGPRPY